MWICSLDYQNNMNQIVNIKDGEIFSVVHTPMMDEGLCYSVVIDNGRINLGYYPSEKEAQNALELIGLFLASDNPRALFLRGGSTPQ